MSTTHVFIVDTKTFPLHLEYEFAGTGAGDHQVDFLLSNTNKSAGTIELTLVGMLADLMRIRQEDKVIFYLQKSSKEGKFYGVFHAASDPFLDDNDGSQYLIAQLGKSLTFRVQIKPDVVYAEGVTEWEALDDLTGLSHAQDLIWSLIYRKLTAGRGNSMVNPYESDRLIALLRAKNSDTPLAATSFTFDQTKQKIVATTSSPSYTGRQASPNLFARLLRKQSLGQQFEAHLQAYCLQEIRTPGSQLQRILVYSKQLEWIGNEVICSVGEQRIDILLTLLSSSGTQRICAPIELKSVCATADITVQLERYVKWLEQYFIPNNPVVHIQPVVIGMEHTNKTSPEYTALRSAFTTFNARHSTNCQPITYIEFTTTTKVNFTKII